MRTGGVISKRSSQATVPPVAGRLPPRELGRFLVLSFAFGWALQVPALFNRAWLGAAALIMFAPLLAALAAGPNSRTIMRRSLARPWPWRWLPLAVAVGMLHKVAGIGIAAATGHGHWNSTNFEFSGFWVTRCETLWLFPAGGEPWPVFLVHSFALQATAGFLIMLPFTLGEELGWRSVLQPALEQRFGPTFGVGLTGLLWGYWHAPLNFARYDDPSGSATLTALVFFPLGATAFAFLIGWVMRGSGSGFIAAAAHGGNNGFRAENFAVAPPYWADRLIDVSIDLPVLLLTIWLIRRQTMSARYRELMSAPQP